MVWMVCVCSGLLHRKPNSIVKGSIVWRGVDYGDSGMKHCVEEAWYHSDMSVELVDGVCQVVRIVSHHGI